MHEKNMVEYTAYDVKARKKVVIQNPKVVKMKNGRWAIKGTSPATGNTVFRIAGAEKPTL
tara:strand:+ start:2313 stop:2492 length:180 start_codon:yes stop_codon:yes gene_type:complete